MLSAIPAAHLSSLEGQGRPDSDHSMLVDTKDIYLGWAGMAASIDPAGNARINLR